MTPALAERLNFKPGAENKAGQLNTERRTRREPGGDR